MLDRVPVLCERCGYDLTGADRSQSCAECGKPVSESLPERRTGSAWQNGGGPVCLIRSAAMIATRPRSAWDGLRIEGRRSAGLLVANSIVAGVLFGVLADSLVAMPLFASGILTLSMVEYLGLRTFGKRNKWRVSAGVAMTVVAHAAIGWSAAALLAALGLRIGGGLNGGLAMPRPVWNLLGRVSLEWSVVLPVVGFLIGMLAFEVLVYLGVRRCRFANPPTASL